MEGGFQFFLMVHFLAANVCLLRYLNPTNDHGMFVSADFFVDFHIITISTLSHQAHRECT
jgi:hypothetical protein